MTSSGETIKSWTHSDMIEPVCIAVDQIYDHILIGDSSCNIYVFKAKTGQHLFTVRQKYKYPCEYFSKNNVYLFFVEYRLTIHKIMGSLLNVLAHLWQ